VHVSGNVSLGRHDGSHSVPDVSGDEQGDGVGEERWG
jgi:hypothetical protein